MHATKNKCSVEGCNQKCRGKGGTCVKHKKPLTITSLMRLSMRSSCCNAACTEGERHEYGQQYCKKCDAACQWKVGT